MTLTEFANKYDLHDSTIEKIEYDKNKKVATFKIDFCQWRQKDFVQGQAENVMIDVNFFAVKELELPNTISKSNTILDVHLILGNTIEIVVLNDDTDDVFILRIYADDVNVCII